MRKVQSMQDLSHPDPDGASIGLRLPVYREESRAMRPSPSVPAFSSFTSQPLRDIKEEAPAHSHSAFPNFFDSSMPDDLFRNFDGAFGGGAGLSLIHI